MPPSLRRRAPQHHLSPPPQTQFPDSGDEASDDDDDMGAEENGEAMGDEMVAIEGEEEDLEDDEASGLFLLFCVIFPLSRHPNQLPFLLLSTISSYRFKEPSRHHTRAGSKFSPLHTNAQQPGFGK